METPEWITLLQLHLFLTTFYNNIFILELKGVDTAQDNGELSNYLLKSDLISLER